MSASVVRCASFDSSSAAVAAANGGLVARDEAVRPGRSPTRTP